ncbi:hypothetical protein KC622_03050 [Candidatus Dojkabacteria bacterium]|uniref:Uncharacterized protein n=1 Tax=Candidatus Dojkabacteria bacterium TaxID=2099670 RepID=A0A955I004_9BACT|nr:hypothetical protein [Candidatus Dojkabacteria bacterium]MCB9790853.1 hypothetical protein [Candidatus Nomurabacteria bacterium]
MNQPIQLSEIEIQEFIKTHKKVTGETLDYEKAKRQATKLMKLMILAVSKVPKSDKKKVDTTNKSQLRAFPFKD